MGILWFLLKLNFWNTLTCQLRTKWSLAFPFTFTQDTSSFLGCKGSLYFGAQSSKTALSERPPALDAGSSHGGYQLRRVCAMASTGTVPQPHVPLPSQLQDRYHSPSFARVLMPADPEGFRAQTLQINSRSGWANLNLACTLLHSLGYRLLSIMYCHPQ